MTFQVTREPRCPGCCERLQSVVIQFIAGWAWCPTCANQGLHAQPHLRFVLDHDAMWQASILSHGLRFYTPQIVDGEYKNLVEMYEWLQSQPEIEVPLPLEWPGFPTEQLRRQYRDAVVEGRVPWRAEVRIPDGFYIAGLTSDLRLVLMQEEPTLLTMPTS